MKLYYSMNLNPRVAVAVACDLRLAVVFVPANPRDPRNKADFHNINPKLPVPVLVEEHWNALETDAIACRLAHLAGLPTSGWLARGLRSFKCG